MTWLALAGVLGAALLLYAIWAALDRAREARDAALLARTEALGEEAVPPTLHPVIDPAKCIGSGGCVRGCPEHEVLGVVGGYGRLVNPLACVGHGECAAGCPVGAIRLVFGTAERGVDLPVVDTSYQTTRPGVYVVGELGGMGLIRNALRQGALAAAHVVSSGRPRPEDALDAVVVGAGPAGTAAALHLLEAGKRVLLLDADRFGGTIQHYPRAKIVMTGTLELPGVGTLRRRTMTKEELVALWERLRGARELPLREGVVARSIAAEPDGAWRVETSHGDHRAANVILALGRRGAPRKLGVPGEELAKVAYRLLEPREFAGKHVLVIGGGNAAVETVIGLAEEGRCRSVGISYRKKELMRCRGDNKAKIDALIAGRRVSAYMPSEVERIEERSVVLRGGDGRRGRLPNDAVIVQIGGTAPAELLRTFGVEITTKYAEA